MTMHNEIAFETALRRAYILQMEIDDSTLERMANTYKLEAHVASAIASKVAGWHAERQAIRK